MAKKKTSKKTKAGKKARVVKKAKTTRPGKKAAGKPRTGKPAAKKAPKKKVSKKKADVKKTAKRKAPAKKSVATRKAAKAAPKRTTGKTASPAAASPLARRVARIRRPVPKMKEQAARKTITVQDVARMTHPGDIEKIISQISDDTKEIQLADATKFDIGIKHNGMAFPEEELPSEYGKDRAVVLIVDPVFVFTYWEVKTESLLEAARHVGPDGKLTLRFYDVSTTYNPEQSNFWDVEVFDRMGNWYLRLGHPEQNICLDIGVKNSQGHFYRITRSNIVKLPPQSLAKPGPIKWMVVTPSGEKSISDIEDYTDADLALLKKILGPYFYDLLMRGRLATIAGSSIEAVFYDVGQLKIGASPSSGSPWTTTR